MHCNFLKKKKKKKKTPKKTKGRGHISARVCCMVFKKGDMGNEMSIFQIFPLDAFDAYGDIREMYSFIYLV